MRNYYHKNTRLKKQQMRNEDDNILPSKAIYAFMCVEFHHLNPT